MSLRKGAKPAATEAKMSRRDGGNVQVFVYAENVCRGKLISQQGRTPARNRKGGGADRKRPAQLLRRYPCASGRSRARLFILAIIGIQIRRPEVQSARGGRWRPRGPGVLGQLASELAGGPDAK